MLAPVEPFLLWVRMLHLDDPESVHQASCQARLEQELWSIQRKLEALGHKASSVKGIRRVLSDWIGGASGRDNVLADETALSRFVHTQRDPWVLLVLWYVVRLDSHVAWLQTETTCVQHLHKKLLSHFEVPDALPSWHWEEVYGRVPVSRWRTTPLWVSFSITGLLLIMLFTGTQWVLSEAVHRLEVVEQIHEGA